ncbi:hypothetical protein HY570_00250 [Candidatus Micrarchaeota archaeon]|nr:hypothetical protein [Candidatus Micrarchaeota archaeon]
MYIKKILVFLLVSLFSALITAVTVNPGELELVEPVNKLIKNGDTVYLGVAGPGQTVFLVANSRVTSGGSNNLGGRWDQIEVRSLPEGWNAEPSLLYEQPMITRITISPNASDGEYEIVVVAIDEGDKEKIGNNVQFIAKVNVSKEVMQVDISPKVIVTGASQPASYVITVRNYGVAADTFEVSSRGVPLWNFTKSLYIGPGSERSINYEITGNEEKEWDVYLKVRFGTTDLMTHEEKVRLVVNTNLISDYKATARGYLIFPLIEWPIYAVTGFLSNFL